MEGEDDGTSGDASSGESGTGNDTAGNDTGGDNSGDSGHADTWFKGADTDTAAFITNKGWNDDPLRAVASYQHLEKLHGKPADSLIELPRADDPEAQKAFWEKMGAPTEAAGYKFEAPEGQQLDPKYETWARDKFLELGIPAEKAAALFHANNEYYNANQAEIAKEYEQKVVVDKAALKEEWRDGHDKMLNRASTAAKSLGFTVDALNAVEAAIGYGATMKLFANIGGKMTEDNFVSGDESNSFNGELTPAEAASELETLKLDKNFTSALTDGTHAGHKAAIAKRRALMEKAFPQQGGTEGLPRV
jgi:hypothetical protein